MAQQETANDIAHTFDNVFKGLGALPFTYCTFNMPLRQYSFIWLPFGIISFSEIFHYAMDHVIERLDGVCAYIDDIVVWGSSLQEHNERLFKLFRRMQKYGLKLNRAKC